MNPMWIWRSFKDGPKIADRLACGDEALEQIILQFLVDLNHQRAAEEAQGHIRYLRPEFQNPDGLQTQETVPLALSKTEIAATIAAKEARKWPTKLSAQVQAIQSLGPDTHLLSQQFGRASQKRQQDIQEILNTLKALGQL